MVNCQEGFLRTFNLLNRAATESQWLELLITCINIAKSEQSSHTPGGSHQRPLYLERKMDKGTDKQYVAESFIHSTTSHIRYEKLYCV